MNRLTLQPVAVFASLVLASGMFIGCEQAANEPQATNSGGAIDSNETIALPANLFLTEAPTDSKNLLKAKSDANMGDSVTFTARVGGSRKPFVDNRAMFFVVDSAIPDCNQMGEKDHCKTPWDYCCEPRENLRKNMATVQIVDADGKPLELSLIDTNDLNPSRTVYVVGKVDQKDDAGNFVVNATGLYVEPEEG